MVLVGHGSAERAGAGRTYTYPEIEKFRTLYE
jgi:hypothetical protein